MRENYTWFKVYRKIENWQWFKDSKTVHVFIYLLCRANVIDVKRKDKVLKRGQILTSYKQIADSTGLSVSSVRRAIENLINSGEISANATNRYTLITISKFNIYQAKYANLEELPKTEQKRTQSAKNKKNQNENNTTEIHTNESINEHSDSNYIPKAFEYYIPVPKHYWGKFNSEEEWYQYANEHWPEVEEWVMN